VPLTIGDLARRLRVSPRALRHYEAVGLLRPSHVDARTGYRYYGPAELARGMQIEQLKAAGLPLASIARILDDDVPMVEALEVHRSQLLGAITEQQHHLAVVEAMLNASDEALRPELVEVGAVHALVTEAACSADELNGTVRRLLQRLRRHAVRHQDVTPIAYSAAFPLVPAADMTTRVAAHIDAPCAGSVVLGGVSAVAVDVLGAHALLPLAQDAAVAEARSRGLRPCGWVWEHYLEIGRLSRTRLLVPVAAAS
jgi:DNA-binding transcriptional MerR regulator